MSLALVDLRALPEGQREIEMKRLAIEEARRPFDLARGPLLRATLLRLNEQEYVGLLTMHHIISDGWSIGILIRELAIFYEAFSSEDPPHCPNCRFSTRTLRLGSDIGCRARCWMFS